MSARRLVIRQVGELKQSDVQRLSKRRRVRWILRSPPQFQFMKKLAEAIQHGPARQEEIQRFAFLGHQRQSIMYSKTRDDSLVIFYVDFRCLIPLCRVCCFIRQDEVVRSEIDDDRLRQERLCRRRSILMGRENPCAAFAVESRRASSGENFREVQHARVVVVLGHSDAAPSDGVVFCFQIGSEKIIPGFDVTFVGVRRDERRAVGTVIGIRVAVVAISSSDGVTEELNSSCVRG